MTNKTVSILGCGWVGLPLAEQLLYEGYWVKGSTTSAEKVNLLRQKGIEACQLQLTPNPIGDLDTLLKADTLVIDIPPKAARLGDDFHPQQIRLLTDAIRLSTVSHVIYVSSTSVYPELNRVVAEEDVLFSDQSAAPALVVAEQLIQQFSPERSITILRCGGLMGYDRIPGKYVAGKTVDSGAVPVNYLHRDDAIGVLQTVIEKTLTGIFNAVAPEHPNREAIYRKSCTDFGYALPAFIAPESPIGYKIISSDKFSQATNYRFRYPDPLQFYYAL